MRTFDLAPLYRSTVGFDRLFSMLDQVSGFDSGSTYPPYNIERTGENAYRITLAVAGFAENEISIEAKQNTLTVKGEKQTKTDEKKGEVLYQGIAARAFERVFQLAEHVEVKGAALENGLLEGTGQGADSTLESGTLEGLLLHSNDRIRTPCRRPLSGSAECADGRADAARRSSARAVRYRPDIFRHPCGVNW